MHNVPKCQHMQTEGVDITAVNKHMSKNNKNVTWNKLHQNIQSAQTSYVSREFKCNTLLHETPDLDTGIS
jgi:hypothetical protein